MHLLVVPHLNNNSVTNGSAFDRQLMAMGARLDLIGGSNWWERSWLVRVSTPRHQSTAALRVDLSGARENRDGRP